MAFLGLGNSSSWSPCHSIIRGLGQICNSECVLFCHLLVVANKEMNEQMNFDNFCCLLDALLTAGDASNDVNNHNTIKTSYNQESSMLVGC